MIYKNNLIKHYLNYNFYCLYFYYIEFNIKKNKIVKLIYKKKIIYFFCEKMMLKGYLYN